MKSTVFNTSLFTKSLFRRNNPKSATYKRGAVTVAVDLPVLLPSQTLRMVGSCKVLGEWDSNKGVDMMDGKFPLWESKPLKITDELLASEYKFVIIDTQTGHLLKWEDGENRRFCVSSGELSNGELSNGELSNGELSSDSLYIKVEEPKFNRPDWRGAGVAIPLFSLRSKESMGVGDFMDLKKMVDWVVMTGQKIIQILPINDSTMTHTWEDSYPYNANSIFALHPQYISLKRAGELQDPDMQAEIEAEGERLNALEKIDYVEVNRLKDRYMRLLYAQKGAEVLASKDFRNFHAQNSYWLDSYALFSLLRDQYQTVDFEKWGDGAKYSEELLKRYTSKRSKSYKELAYYYFVQYNLHIQLLEAREYARERGVAFKGDIPIGVSRTSVDVWVAPKLFHLNSQAGAPPDDFSVLGQNWGFPTYNWREMAKDGYSWWRARFTKMAEYFDAYRIDHILGFFRIWEIPLDAVHGLLGHFSPAMPYTVEEIEAFGFRFDKSYTTPDINHWLIGKLFGVHASDVEKEYLRKSKDGIGYTLKTKYNTQAKIAREVVDEDLHLPLMSLLDEVLFIEDPYKKGYYHPRISAQNTYKYCAMSEADRVSYDALYNHFYYHRHNDFWFSEAMAKLPALVGSTDMLTCGEDLGMIPSCVPDVMERLSIIALEIQRMPKDPNVTFADPARYDYMTVCTTSTHDMTPIRAWLLEDYHISKRYLSDVLSRYDCDVMSDPSPEMCEQIIAAHLASPAMWTILPLQDWLSIDGELRAEDPHSERINIPASSRHYWRYRMHTNIEELIESEELNRKISTMVSQFGR